MSDYYSLRKAGFPAKKLRAMGITKKFPDNPRFKKEHLNLTEQMPNLQGFGWTETEVSVFLEVIGCVFGYYEIPLDTPFSMYEIPNSHNSTSIYQCPIETNFELSKLPKNSAWHKLIMKDKHNIGLGNYQSILQTLQVFTHELAHFVDTVKGRMVFEPNMEFHNFDGETYDFVRAEKSCSGSLQSRAYDNQPHEISANVRGLKILNAYSKLKNHADFIMPRQIYESFMAYHIDPMNCPYETVRKFDEWLPIKITQADA